MWVSGHPCETWAKHGRWLNVAKIELSVLQSQCLDRRIPHINAMRDEVTAWESERNKRAITNSRQFTTAQTRINLIWSAEAVGKFSNNKKPGALFPKHRA
jgi:hypothetical protein